MNKSHLSAVRAVSVVGSASVLNVVLGVIKMKVAASLLGPAGVGLIGLFQQLVHVVSTLFGMGIRNAGTRQIADAKVNRSEAELDTIRRAMWRGTVALAICGAAFLFFSRDLLAKHVLQTPLQAAELGWLAIGVALTVGAASQQALLNGARQVRELALVTVLTGALSAVIAIAALVFWRDQAVVIFVLASPLASFVLGHVFVARMPAVSTPTSPRAEVIAEFGKMLRFGTPIMLAALVVAAGHLAVRTLIQRELGGEALGLFTAAWLISQYHIAFLYAAIKMDYFPRLTAAMNDKEKACRIINEQTEIGLLFAAPLVLGLIAIGPYALWMLYTEEFVPAAKVLSWLLLGDILKILVEPLGICLMAARAGKTFFYVKLFEVITFLTGALLFAP